MSEFKLLVIAVLLWGTSHLVANATGNDGLVLYKAKIMNQVDALNTSIPDLNLRQLREPLNVPAALQTLEDIRKLDSALKGAESLPEHSLTTLVCSRALCFKED